MNVRQSDLVRDWLVAFTDTLARDYFPAVAWQEDTAPFNEKYKSSGVIYCSQEGIPVDAFVRQVNVNIFMFSPMNSSQSDLNNLFQDATETLEYIKQNFDINTDLLASVSQDVTGPFWTAQNRRYYRFSVLTYSE